MMPLSYYLNDNVIFLSKDLLGKFLFTKIEGQEITGGMIVETEAYRGPEDRASHAYKNRRTPRTEAMFKAGGICYVYLCYGIHHLFNIVTNQEGIPHAILIRAIQATTGSDTILKRRKKTNIAPNLTAGPASLAKALGIEQRHNTQPLTGPIIWLEDRKIHIPKSQIICSPRVGIHYAQKDALLPWRFRIRGNPWTSPAK